MLSLSTGIRNTEFGIRNVSVSRFSICNCVSFGVSFDGNVTQRMQTCVDRERGLYHNVRKRERERESENETASTIYKLKSNLVFYDSSAVIKMFCPLCTELPPPPCPHPTSLLPITITIAEQYPFSLLLLLLLLLLFSAFTAFTFIDASPSTSSSSPSSWQTFYVLLVVVELNKYLGGERGVAV